MLAKAKLGQRLVRKHLKKLSKALPLRKPVRLRFIPYNNEEHGLAYETARLYWIEVALMPCEECMASTLWEEYAHLLAWKSGDLKRKPTLHDTAFDLEIGRVRRAVQPD